jgi:hypothetical protein
MHTLLVLKVSQKLQGYDVIINGGKEHLLGHHFEGT